MKKRISLILLAVLTFVLVACKPNERFQKFSLTVTCQGDAGEKEYMNVIANRYMELNSDVQVTIKDFGGKDFQSFMQYNVSQPRNLGDVIWTADDVFAEYAQAGYFVDLRPLYESDPSTDYSLYYESMLHTASFYGQFMPTTSYSGSYVSEEFGAEKNDDASHALYFAPRDYNRPVVVINTDLFRKAGIEIPEEYYTSWTYDQFFDLIKTISEKIKSYKTEDIEGVDASTIKKVANSKAIYFFLTWEPIYMTIYEALGGDPLIDENGYFNLGTEKNVEISKYINEKLSLNEYMIESNQTHFYDTQNVFMTIQVRSTIVTDAGYLKTINADGTTTYNLDFLPLPTGESELIGSGCSGYAIVKNQSTNKQTVNGVTKTTEEIAWDFIKFIISEEGQDLAGESGANVPVLKSLSETGKWLNYLDKGLNHKAFVAGKELRLKIYNIYSPKNSLRQTLRADMNSYMKQLLNQDCDVEENVSVYQSRFNEKVSEDVLLK